MYAIFIFFFLIRIPHFVITQAVGNPINFLKKLPQIAHIHLFKISDPAHKWSITAGLNKLWA